MPGGHTDTKTSWARAQHGTTRAHCGGSSMGNVHLEEVCGICTSDNRGGSGRGATACYYTQGVSYAHLGTTSQSGNVSGSMEVGG